MPSESVNRWTANAALAAAVLLVMGVLGWAIAGKFVSKPVAVAPPTAVTATPVPVTPTLAPAPEPPPIPPVATVEPAPLPEPQVVADAGPGASPPAELPLDAAQRRQQLQDRVQNFRQQLQDPAARQQLQDQVDQLRQQLQDPAVQQQLRDRFQQLRNGRQGGNQNDPNAGQGAGG